MAVPQELLDSARIDGAGDGSICWRIVLPLSKAVIAVVGLFYAVGYWNAFFNALLYIDDNDNWPIQRLLQSYLVGRARSGDQVAAGDCRRRWPSRWRSW